LLDADGDGDREAESFGVRVGLDFVSLLGEVEVGFGGTKDGGEVLEAVLLLLEKEEDGRVRGGGSSGQSGPDERERRKVEREGRRGDARVDSRCS
jgi:hypothetical protein